MHWITSLFRFSGRVGRKSYSQMQKRAFAFLLFLVSLVIGAALRDLFAKKVLESQTWSLLFVLILLGLIAVMVHHLIQEMDHLRHRIGIKINYLEREKHRGNLYREAKKVIEKAQSSIQVLDALTIEKTEGEGPEEAEERKNYYAALLNRVRDGQGKVTYERLLQIRNPNEEFRNWIKNTEYCRHLHDILESRDSYKVSLVKVKAKRVTTFVLVDNRWLIWQINEIVNNNPNNTEVERSLEEWKMLGIFIIEDPHGEITRHFSDFIAAIKGNPLGGVEPTELPPRPSE